MTKTMKPLSFKLWIRLSAWAPLLFIGTMAGFVFPNHIISPFLSYGGLILLTPLCMAGGVMGILLSLGKLYFACPFCSTSSKVVGGNKRLLCLECPKCGMITGTYSRFPPLTYRIEKGQP